MDVEQGEAMACLSVLVALMKADGAIDSDERKSLAAAVAGFEQHVGEPLSVDELVGSDIDLDAALAQVTSAEARAQLYRSACFMVRADGKEHPAERAMLERIALVTAPTDEERERVARILPSRATQGRVAAFVDGIGGLFRSRKK